MTKHSIRPAVNLADRELSANEFGPHQSYIADLKGFVALPANLRIVLRETCAGSAFDHSTNARFACRVFLQFKRPAVTRTLHSLKGSPEGDVLRQRNSLPQHNTFNRPFQLRSSSDVSEQMPRKQFPANIVGLQIRKARYQLGLSQEELAMRFQLLGHDISRSTLAQIEIRVRFVSDEELLIFAIILNLTTDDLFTTEMKRWFRGKVAKARNSKRPGQSSPRLS